MDLITESIAIGTFLDARDADQLRRFNIRSIVCLDGTLAPTEPDPAQIDEVEVFDLIDDPGNRPELFAEAVRTIGDLSGQCPVTLVHCRAGRSRSVVAVAAHLMATRIWTSAKALEFVTSKRAAELTPGIEELLRGRR